MKKNNHTPPLYQATRRLTQSLTLSLPQLLLLALLLTACANDDIIGEQAGNKAITFDITTSKLTRADNLEEYVKDFRVYGINGSFDNTGTTFTQAYKVMDSYVVWWNDNTAATSLTNSSDWEYVGSYAGSSSDAQRSNLDADAQARIAKQSIKYWDYGQPYHVFYGLAKADNGSFIYNETSHTTQGKLSLSSLPTSREAANALFYTDPILVKKDDYAQPVKMVFKHLLSQVRVGFYETIPGYAVKDVKFYSSLSSNASPGTEVVLHGSFINNGAFTIDYDLNEAAPAATFTVSSNGTPTTSLTLGTIRYATNVQENLLDAGSYLNHGSASPTYALGQYGGTDQYTFVMPNNNAKPITIKCDYTLVGNDHASEDDNDIIYVKGATATIPAEYCQWKPNYVYTYIFKISDNTNGGTGTTTDPAGLYPISFDTVVADEGTQQNTIDVTHTTP